MWTLCPSDGWKDVLLSYTLFKEQVWHFLLAIQTWIQSPILLQTSRSSYATDSCIQRIPQEFYILQEILQNSSEFPEISNRSWSILNSNWQFWVWPNWRWTEYYMDTYSNYNNALSSHKELMNYYLKNKCLMNNKITVYFVRKMWAFAFKNSREHYKWKLRNTKLKKQKFLVTCFDSNLKLAVKNITIPCPVYTD